jgi:hypothetical protein
MASTTKLAPEDVARLRWRVYAGSPLMRAMRRALRATEVYLAELERLHRAEDASCLCGLWDRAGLPQADDDNARDLLDVEADVNREMWGVRWAVEHLHDYLASNVVRRPSRSR